MSEQEEIKKVSLEIAALRDLEKKLNKKIKIFQKLKLETEIKLETETKKNKHELFQWIIILILSASQLYFLL